MARHKRATNGLGATIAERRARDRVESSSYGRSQYPQTARQVAVPPGTEFLTAAILLCGRPATTPEPAAKSLTVYERATLDRTHLA